MDKKGQIFSLDFLLSIILVVLALGLILNTMELNVYNMKEEEMKRELRTIGETAADLLVSSPDIVCQLVDINDNNIDYLRNCIPKINAEAYRIDLDDLSIPAGYNCKIENEAISAGSWQTKCITTPLPDVDNIYSAERIIVLYSGTGSPIEKKKISKDKLENCMRGGSCPLNQSKLTLWVWKE